MQRLGEEAYNAEQMEKREILDRLLAEYNDGRKNMLYIAAAQYRRIINSVRKLDDMPLRFPLYKDDPWNSLGMRWFPMDNYLVFYFVDEQAKEVDIARSMFKGRDIRKQLGNDE